MPSPLSTNIEKPASCQQPGGLMHLESIKKKIAQVMSQGESYESARPFSTLLFLLSLLYRGLVRQRIRLYRCGVFKSRKLPCMVISVGNITVGGVGKTPVVIYIVELLKALGYNVAVLSRGYKGKMYKQGGIVSDGQKVYMSSAAAGDEPYLMAQKLKDVPVLIGKNRFEMGCKAIRRFYTQILVMDDGFQHIQLDRDIDLLLLDSARPFGNGYCIPRGPLREPLAGIKRAGAIVLTRHESTVCQAGTDLKKEIGDEKTPVFRCEHVPTRLSVAGSGPSLAVTSLKGRKLFAFSGISRNDSFRKTVTDLGGTIDGYVDFFDHHPYSSEDLLLIWKQATQFKVDNVVTTEKDYVRICTQLPKTPPLLILEVSISFGSDNDGFERYITNRISKGEQRYS